MIFPQTHLSRYALIFLLLFFIAPITKLQAATVNYTLTINNQPVNLSGKKQVDFALTVNGGIPAPTLEFTEGDDAEITVINGLEDEEVSIHWHGILLPPEEDGVAYVNTPPIFGGQSRTFKFKIRQHGTYWYHSHTFLQEQKGVYGAIVIHPKNEVKKYDHDVVAVLSDWSDEDADQIIKNLRKDGDYYLYKKNSVRSYSGAMANGGLFSQLTNEWRRMGGMDLSDVGYDAFLINGKKSSQLAAAHPGQRVRVRVINAAASSYFYVSLADQSMEVIAADGVDIAPLKAKELLIGMAETYDIVFTVPEHKNYELRATCQDITGYTSAWIGMGDNVHAPAKAAHDLYASMDHSAHGNHGDQVEHAGHASDDQHGNHQPVQVHDHTASTEGAHAQHQHHAAAATEESQNLAQVELLTVDEIRSPQKTTFTKQLLKNPIVHEIKLVLDGDMERYVWHINGKTIQQDTLINVSEGEVVRMTFVNNTMMHHPMHLHGHFFRVLNQAGDFSPLKHTVDVSPHMTRVIEFYTDEPGQWMLHCHNLYHMKTGMARVIKYMSWQPSPEMAQHARHDPHLHDHWYAFGSALFATNTVSLYARGSQTWNQIDLKLEGKSQSSRFKNFNKRWEVDGDAIYRRWFSNYLNVFAGGSAYHDNGYAVAGISYVLPFLIEADVMINHHGWPRFDLHRHFQWSTNINSDLEFSRRWYWSKDHGQSVADGGVTNEF